MTAETETCRALLPRQYVGRWKNDEGVTFNVIQYVDEATTQLTKIFIPVPDYRNLEVKTFLGKVCKLTLDEDEDGRTVLKGIELDNAD